MVSNPDQEPNTPSNITGPVDSVSGSGPAPSSQDIVGAHGATNGPKRGSYDRENPTRLFGKATDCKKRTHSDAHSPK